MARYAEVLINTPRVADLDPWQHDAWVLLGTAKAHWASPIGVFPQTACASRPLMAAQRRDPAAVAAADRCRSAGCRARWAAFDEAA